MQNNFSQAIAVVIPCLNEENSILHVIREFNKFLPEAHVYVYDNGSTDQTRNLASEAGATVRLEHKRGKGNVLRRAFSDVEADIYVIIDGDGTYEVAAVGNMISLLISEGLDMVTGVRKDSVASSNTYRKGHRIGNVIFSNILRIVFGSNSQDVLSGYRILTKRFVKSFPSNSRGFEIEVEMTAHASFIRVPTGELETAYSERHSASASKLHTYRDGAKIARALFKIFRSNSPSRFFGSASLLCALLSLIPFLYWLGSSFTKVTALVAFGFISIFSIIFLVIGIVLNSLTRLRLDLLRLEYLHQGSSS